MSQGVANPLGSMARRLRVKREFLVDAARQYAHGVCPLADLELAAVEFSEAKAEADAKRRRGEETDDDGDK